MGRKKKKKKKKHATFSMLLTMAQWQRSGTSMSWVWSPALEGRVSLRMLTLRANEKVWRWYGLCIVFLFVFLFFFLTLSQPLWNLGTPNMLTKVFEDIHASIGRAVTEHTAHFMKVPIIWIFPICSFLCEEMLLSVLGYQRQSWTLVLDK